MKGKLSDIVTIVCYGDKEVMTRKEARAKYRDAVRHSEGAERDRYLNILFDLEDGLTECHDE